MHFVLFIPDSDDSSGSLEDVFSGIGCDHLLEGVQTPVPVREGPGGSPGKLFRWMTNSGQVHSYEPDHWEPAVPDDDYPAGRYYIGVSSTSLPTPDDLLRRYPFAGKHVVMGDSQRWLIPQERELPFDVRLSDDGSKRFVPMRRFHQMHILAEEWRRALSVAVQGHRFIEQELCDYIDHALSVNYRIIPELTYNILGLYTSGPSGSIHPALSAVVAITNPQPGVIHG